MISDSEHDGDTPALATYENAEIDQDCYPVKNSNLIVVSHFKFLWDLENTVHCVRVPCKYKLGLKFVPRHAKTSWALLLGLNEASTAISEIEL